MPLVERQSYIIPTIVEALRETITERGITNKHVLSKLSVIKLLGHVINFHCVSSWHSKRRHR